MDRMDLLEALAAADAEIERKGTTRLGPNGLEHVPTPPPAPWTPPRPRWTGKPRRNSKQGRRGRE